MFFHGRELALALVATFAAGTVSAGSEFLYPQPLLPMLEEPAGVIAVDLDGDGLLDLVSANRDTGDIAVLMGQADGMFAPDQRFPACGGSLGAAFPTSGDFDENGTLDLAVTCSFTGVVSILLGNGDGTFGPSAEYGSPGEDPWIAQTGDFNNDDHLDLIVANHVNGGAITMNLGNGDGTFGPELMIDPGAPCYTVAVGDFDGDDNDDFVRAQNGNLEIHLGNGDGTFAPPLLFPGSATHVVAVDLNGDSILDLVAAEGEAANQVSVRLGNGDGTFGERQQYATGEDNPNFVAVTDFNGDQLPDLAVNVREALTTSLWLLLGTGAGTFAAAAPLSVGSGPNALAVGDINGDSSADLAVVHEGSDDLRIYSGNGAGAFTESQIVPFSWPNNPRELIVTDMNDDGLLDVAVGVGPRVEALINTGSGVLELESGFAITGSATGIGGADFNGDALQDLVVSNQGADSVAILLNQSGPDTLTFTADAGALVWPAVLGALSYNVYRGNVATLVDTDDDGLPDGGYGMCLTALDPDPTDTFFDDPEIPAAEAGFFYLRSVVDAGGEGGLGTTSAGLPRVPAVACP